MGLREQQDVLARLYTDTRFRIEFFSEPGRMAAEAGLSPDEANEIAALAPDDLRYFAASLIAKRQREVARLLPLVRDAIGNEFESTFHRFVEGFNLAGVRKHLDDAMSFCRFLEAEPSETLAVRNAARFERIRLQFFGFDKRFAFVFLQADPRFGGNVAAVDRRFGPRRLPSIAVWVRVRGAVKHLVF